MMWDFQITTPEEITHEEYMWELYTIADEKINSLWEEFARNNKDLDVTTYNMRAQRMSELINTCLIEADNLCNKTSGCTKKKFSELITKKLKDEYRTGRGRSRRQRNSRKKKPQTKRRRSHHRRRKTKGRKKHSTKN